MQGRRQTLNALSQFGKSLLPSVHLTAVQPKYATNTLQTGVTVDGDGNVDPNTTLSSYDAK